jgi:hypothetical protein
MPPKKKAPKIRWRGGGSRVDEEMDAVDYADEYDDDYEQDSKYTKPDPKVEAPKPKSAEAPKPKAPEPKQAEKPKIEEPEDDPFAKEPVLETFDNWEDAMDALDSHMTKEEEARANQRNTKK